MIELYTWNTPNGQKIPIFLEETGTPYNFHPVHIGKGEQKTPEFLAINPNGKIPAIVDTEGPDGKPLRVFESGAILQYLAQKTGQLLPAHPRHRVEALAWLAFQIGGVGPMFGQVGFFLRAKERNEQAIERYTTESQRLFGVLERRLGEEEYLAVEYSIADIATYPWVRASQFIGSDFMQQALEDSPNVRRWYDAIAKRPAVERALQITKEKSQ
ncbi:glutathione S-transferase family protein [Gloeobacter violaceus]|uniref:Gll4346 protein n=1 Tax=Gloeobacter violaceus (strain ATCC 29082 / PCC 7421) TaxID=251221 RepID=Q7ND90_GLOVI|nr:glutathione S-transferase N-terminal domain-containing protein [Gloeobacter violaceus]BAC92287.1 gll4346 [Gloeobacter violaceus PCC 7421]